MPRLNANQNYEVQAEAFHTMTGYMAPGKDRAPALGCDGLSDRERVEIWTAWLKEHRAYWLAIRAAFEHHVYSPLMEDDDAEA